MLGPAGGAAVDVSDGGSARLASLGRTDQSSVAAVRVRWNGVHARPEHAAHRTGPRDRGARTWAHTGLPHTLGFGNVAGGAVALPYIGIGGARVRTVARLQLEIHDKLRYGDIMSSRPYGGHRPTRGTGSSRRSSLGPALRCRPPAPAGPLPRAAPGMRPHLPGGPALRTRRLVSGIVTGKQGVILRSFVAGAAKPMNIGTVIGRIVARDKRGREVRTLKVRGSSPRARRAKRRHSRSPYPRRSGSGRSPFCPPPEPSRPTISRRPSMRRRDVCCECPGGRRRSER